MSELIAALAGAIVGAALAVGAAYLQRTWSRADAVRADRLVLVREIMRFRLDQHKLIGPLNEIPLAFGDDAEALRLYRTTLNAPTDGARTSALTDLINHLAAVVGLPKGVHASDIQRGFSLRD